MNTIRQVAHGVVLLAVTGRALLRLALDALAAWRGKR